MIKKSGVTKERKYVNKSEDYETRYAKDKPKRKGYKGVREFSGGGDVDSSLDILKAETIAYSIEKYGEPIDEETFMVSGLKKDGEDDVFRFVFAETLSGKDIKLTPEQLFDNDRATKFKGGGEISKEKKEAIAKLQKLIDSDNPMITDAVKEKAKKKIEELSKVEEVDSRKKDEFIKSKHKGEKEISFIKSEKVTEIENGKESENFFKTGEAMYGRIVSENSTQYLVKSSNLEGVEYLVNKDSVKLITVKTPSKPITTKTPIKKADSVLKKTSTRMPRVAKQKEKVLGIEYTVGTKGHKDALARLKYVEDLNKSETSRVDKKEKKTEIILGKKYVVDSPEYKTAVSTKKELDRLQSRIDASKEPKKETSSWKEKLASLKNKKGYKGNIKKLTKPVSGTKSRNIKRDLDKKALPMGKRISKAGSNQYGKSEGGNVYHENRPNRSDVDPKENFGKGGEVKHSGWGINTNW